MTIVGVAYFATRPHPPEVPVMANAGNAAPGTAASGNALSGDAGGVVRAPDISNLTPKEQFTRLVARIDRAATADDTATIINFTPMALGAYANLPPGDRDVDARFQAGILATRAGLVDSANAPAMFDNARALADTILGESPGNLTGYYLRAIVADGAGDTRAAQAARAAFRSHYDAEIGRDRPEYRANHDRLQGFFRGGEGSRP
ncbi:MAG: hypothetical protein ACREK8_11030 [Gemmatimonadales bacterium]